MTATTHAILKPAVTAAGEARACTRRACDGTTSTELADEVTLVVSELVTNAVRHGGGTVNLSLRVWPAEVLVTVQDKGASFDWASAASEPAAVNGRGLGIVSALATTWGVRTSGTGKSVWCIVRQSR